MPPLMEGLSFRQRVLLRLAAIVLVLHVLAIVSVAVMLLTGFMQIYWNGCQCGM